MAADDRLDRIEARLSALEDMNAILQLMAAYGPAVDRLDAEATVALWTEDGSYDWGSGAVTGTEALRGIVRNPLHESYVAAGSAHVLGLPRVTLQGDRAAAVSYSRVYLHDGAGWKVERCAANRWSFVRGPDGWRIEHRQNRLLNGAEAARALLADPAETGLP